MAGRQLPKPGGDLDEHQPIQDSAHLLQTIPQNIPFLCIQTEHNSEILDAEIKKLIDINLFGVFHMTKSVLNKMADAEKGVIINIGSISSERAIPRVHLAAYSATKAAITMFTKSIAVEYARKNIRCNGVNPGIINSGMIKPYLDDPQARKVLEERLPLARIGEPIDVANAVLFLASDEANWITGTILNVDGGKTASEG